METLMMRYRKLVTSIAYQALGNSDDAWDVTQETLVYAIMHLPHLREKTKFVGWLRQVTLSQCVDFRRRKGTRRLGEPITLLNERSEEALHDDRMMIQGAISQLSEELQAAVHLRFFGGWTIEETAELLEVPVGTLKSRLATAKKRLRADLDSLMVQRIPKIEMIENAFSLSEIQTKMIYDTFPGAKLISVRNDIEPWMPFNTRVKLTLSDKDSGEFEKEVDFRDDIDPLRAELMPVMNRLGIPCSNPLSKPTSKESGGFLTLCEPAKGENLLLWAMGGTPHRIRLATERAFEAIDRLQGVTEALMTDPIGAKLPRRTLSDEADALLDDAKWNANRWLSEENGDIRGWREDEWFRASLKRVQLSVAKIETPLVFTDYFHFFPNFVRIQPTEDAYAEPLGWPGDIRYAENPVVEFTNPFGYFGDPLLGLSMVWIYDCYPFVHAGFVEQFLWRRGVSRKEFAPRLALQALKVIARQLPVDPSEGGGFREALYGYVNQALSWM